MGSSSLGTGTVGGSVQRTSEFITNGDSSTGSFAAYDRSNPAVYTSLSSITLLGAKKPWVNGNYAFVGYNTTNLAVVDVSNPRNISVID